MQFDIVANDKATGSMKGVEQSMEKFTTRLSANFSKLAMKAAAAYAIISKIGQVFKEGASIADEAKRLNLTADAYQRIAYAAERAGASPQELAKGFKDLNKLMDEAATKGQGPQFEALKALGFSDAEILNREIKRTEVLNRLADAMSAVNDEEQKFAVASRVLGDKAAMSLMPALDNFEQFQTDMANAPVLSDAQVAALDATDDALTGIINKGTKLVQAGIAEATSALAGGDLGAPTPPKPISPEAASRANALLGVGAKKDAGKVSPETLSMAAIGGASAQVLRGVGMKSPEQETAENTRRLVELATAPAPAAGAPTGVSRAFTEGVTDLQKVYQAHPIQYKSVPFRINAPSTR